MSNTATDSRWLSKQESADLLGVSTKTIQKYVSQGKLSCKYERTKTGDAMFIPESEVLSLREQQQQATHKPLIEPPSLPAVINQMLPSLGVEEQLSRFLGSIELFFNQQRAKPDTITISIKEASLLTGLTQRFINEAINRGELKVIRDGKRKRLVTEQVREWVKKL